MGHGHVNYLVCVKGCMLDVLCVDSRLIPVWIELLSWYGYIKYVTANVKGSVEDVLLRL